MSAIVVLEWKFSLPDYFETRREIKQDDYTMIIDDGKVEVTMDSAVYDENPLVCNALHEKLNRLFLGVQICSHKVYELSSQPTPTRVYPDGHRLISLKGKAVALSSANAEYQVLNKEGIVVADSRRDRIKKWDDLADLFIQHQKDEVLTSLQESYKASVEDPDDELVHLYEIRDAISSKFGSQKTAQSALKISELDWKRLGELANHEPLLQGRHRGKSSGALRGATHAELAEARGIARTMIEAYLRYLDTTAHSSGPK